MHAALHDIKFMDPNRKQIVIFTTVFGLTANYFAASPMIDFRSMWLSALEHAASLGGGKLIYCPHILTEQSLIGNPPFFALLKEQFMRFVWDCQRWNKKILVYKLGLLLFYRIVHF